MLRLSGMVARIALRYLIWTWRVIADQLSLGLLNEDDNGRTDLGTLEKRLADKRESQGRRRASTATGSHPTSPVQGTPVDGGGSTPRSTLASPEPQSQSKNGDKHPAEPEKTEEEVEALSDMMCSLVTNNCGETRYIGTQCQTKM